MLFEHTKSRPGNSNDAMAELNQRIGAVVRKHMGYSHMAARTPKRSSGFTKSMSTRIELSSAVWRAPAATPSRAADADAKPELFARLVFVF